MKEQIVELVQAPALSQKVATYSTYAVGANLVIGDVMDYLGDHASAFGVIIGFMTFLTNVYFQWKRGRKD